MFSSTFAPLAASLALENDFFLLFISLHFFPCRYRQLYGGYLGAAVAASLGLENVEVGGGGCGGGGGGGWGGGHALGGVGGSRSGGSAGEGGLEGLDDVAVGEAMSDLEMGLPSGSTLLLYMCPLW